MILKQRITRIPSKLYFDLWSRGNDNPKTSGDRMIAVYAMLKSYRDGEIKYSAYKSRNNKTVSGYALLRKKTNLSLNTLKLYVPVLIDMGLCLFDKNGDFVLVGGEKIKELYNSYKLIPIIIGANLIKTSYYSYYVRAHSSERRQRKQIEIKKHRSETIKQGDNPRTNREYKAACRMYKRFPEIEITDNVILSNRGYANLKDGSINKTSKGQYWKSKMKLNGFIKSKRRFDLIQRMSLHQYFCLKEDGGVKNCQTYRYGHLVEETVALLEVVNQVDKFVEPTAVLSKRLPLVPSIDFLDWWSKH